MSAWSTRGSTSATWTSCTSPAPGSTSASRFPARVTRPTPSSGERLPDHAAEIHLRACAGGAVEEYFRPIVSRQTDRSGGHGALRGAVIACACLALAVAAPLQAQDTLLGVIWDRSVLVSLDPHAGTVTGTHLQLNPYESFTALAHDPGHHRIFA